MPEEVLERPDHVLKSGRSIFELDNVRLGEGSYIRIATPMVAPEFEQLSDL
jgi:hypothetical protein